MNDYVAVNWHLLPNYTEYRAVELGISVTSGFQNSPQCVIPNLRHIKRHLVYEHTKLINLFQSNAVDRQASYANC